VKEIVNLFAPNGYVEEKVLVAKNLQRPSPDKIFTNQKLNGKLVLVPASSALAVVIGNDLEEPPSLEKLKQILKN